MAACLRVEKQTFNPNTNYFDLEYVTIERELDHYEDELWDKREKCGHRGFWSVGLGIFIAIGCFIGFGLMMEVSKLYVIGVIFGIACFFGGFILAHGYFWKKEQDYSEELHSYRYNHKEELWAEALAEVKAYNEEQERIAETWRAGHPFEEHIRTCIKDPNSSVAIAEAARYYAENYLNREN